MRRTPLMLWAALGLAAVTVAAPARADIYYSNTTNFSGFGYQNGGAAAVGANTITTLVADQIIVGSAYAGATVTSFTFSVANFNTVAVSARPRIRFYASDGTGGGPGTVFAGFSFAAISFTAGSVGLLTANIAGTPFTIPGTSFWAGITFDNNSGATGATAAQLNNLGQGIFNPPTVGSSGDVFFQTTAAGDFLANNPSGGFFNFGGNPVGNFGWAFSGPSTAAVPEPSPMLLSAAAGMLLAGGTWARRRWAGRSADAA